MTKQPESRLSRSIQKDLRKDLDLFCFKVWGSEHMMAGLPDIIGVVAGQFFGLEVKMPYARDNTSARQEYVHELIRNAGGVVEVVCSIAEARSVVERCRSTARKMHEHPNR